MSGTFSQRLVIKGRWLVLVAFILIVGVSNSSASGFGNVTTEELALLTDVSKKELAKITFTAYPGTTFEWWIDIYKDEKPKPVQQVDRSEKLQPDVSTSHYKTILNVRTESTVSLLFRLKPSVRRLEIVEATIISVSNSGSKSMGRAELSVDFKELWDPQLAWSWSLDLPDFEYNEPLVLKTIRGVRRVDEHATFSGYGPGDVDAMAQQSNVLMVMNCMVTR